MLHSDAEQLLDGTAKSGKSLKTVMVSHAHPDYFMGLDVITERVPKARVVSTPNVVADIRTDGRWMPSMLQGKLGPEGPKRLVILEAPSQPALTAEGIKRDVVEFGECESKHITAVCISPANAIWRLQCAAYYTKAREMPASYPVCT